MLNVTIASNEGEIKYSEHDTQLQKCSQRFKLQATKFPSLQCDPCGLAVQVRNDLREHKKSELRNLSLQCDPCGEGADVSKDLEKHKEIKCDLTSKRE